MFAMQFHGQLTEILNFVISTANTLKLELLVVNREPFLVEYFDATASTAEFINTKRNLEFSFALNEEKTNLNANTRLELRKINPNIVLIDVGIETETELRESCLSLASKEAEFQVTAKKVAARLKRLTKGGAIAVSPKTGAEVKIVSLRYTEGARKLFEQGLKIKPFAGNSLLKLL
jgi:hypothetical protein